MSSPLPETVYQLLNEAKEALGQGEFQRARRLVQKAVGLSPDSEEPWLYLASIASPEALPI
jgi:Flp pilus assembly protein TadD